jgi:hypothetical protein
MNDRNEQIDEWVDDWQGRTYLISVEECLRVTGHCHERTGVYRPSVPPMHEEICKHCGHRRWAVPREPFEYVEE